MLQKNITNNADEFPIDAIILWVDGSDEKHQAKMLPYLEDKSKIETKKFRTRYDQVNEIQYTIDSILKYAKFIRNIFIITDGQTPKFLLDKNDESKYRNVCIVDHKIIFDGYEKYLPVFNSRAIETLMFRIPNLAEHFIYFNDDFFIINKTEVSDFFKKSYPILRGKWLKYDDKKFFKKKRTGHKSAQQKGAKLAHESNYYYNFRHTPHPFRKSTFQEHFNSNKELFENNISYKFRVSDQFLIHSLINHTEIKNETCVLKNDLQLLYFRSYKKPLFWYKFKLNKKSKGKLFLGLQSLDLAPDNIQKYIINWLEKRMS